MADKKKRTPEQEKEIRMLIENNKMLEATKKDMIEKGKTSALSQIESAQKEVIEHIRTLDPSAVPSAGQKQQIRQETMFKDTDVSIFDLIEENERTKKEKSEIVKAADAELPVLEDSVDWTPSDTTIAEDTSFNNTDPSLQYDIIQLPSNGQCYRSKVDRVPVAYLTAYDENIIMSPNLYRDGLVIDYLLKNKVVNSDIDVEDLVSGDADAITLFLRATSYGHEFPLVAVDPDTGEQINTTVDLTTLKPKEFKLVGDENGHFDFVTPIRKDTIKFRYLTRKQEKQLLKVMELESAGSKAQMLDTYRETLLAAIINDKTISENEKKVIRSSAKIMESWAKKLRETDDSKFTKIMTNGMQLQITAVNGNYDREFIRKYINAMPAGDAMALRNYVTENKPGIDFTVEIERPESLGGGSFKTFLAWDDTVFLNIADV